MSELIVPGDENSKPEFNFEDPALAAKVKELKEKLGVTDETESTEELTEEAKVARSEADQGPPPAITGKDVNWENYDLDARYAHLYPTAEMLEMNGGLQWVATIDEFKSDSKNWTGTGVNKLGEPRGAGDYLTWMANGPEKWKLVTILPDGSGLVGIIFQRKVRVALPDPKFIEKEVVVVAPSDVELTDLETQSLKWAGTNAGFVKEVSQKTDKAIVMGMKPEESTEQVQVRMENLIEGRDEPSLVTLAAKQADKARSGPDFGATTGLAEPGILPNPTLEKDNIDESEKKNEGIS